MSNNYELVINTGHDKNTIIPEELKKQIILDGFEKEENLKKKEKVSYQLNKFL